MHANQETLTSSLVDPRGDSNGRNPNSQPVELEQKRVGPHDAIRAGHPLIGRSHMIIKTAMLIIGDDE